MIIFGDTVKGNHGIPTFDYQRRTLETLPGNLHVGISLKEHNMDPRPKTLGGWGGGKDSVLAS